jgi:hypothetical protein
MCFVWEHKATPPVLLKEGDTTVHLMYVFIFKTIQKGGICFYAGV